jgi:hypothetical protein
LLCNGHGMLSDSWMVFANTIGEKAKLRFAADQI